MYVWQSFGFLVTQKSSPLRQRKVQVLKSARKIVLSYSAAAEKAREADLGGAFNKNVGESSLTSWLCCS